MTLAASQRDIIDGRQIVLKKGGKIITFSK